MHCTGGILDIFRAQPWAIIRWTVPFWRQPRPEWWSDSLPVPRGFCFLLLKKTKTHPPRRRTRVASSRPNLFLGFAKPRTAYICRRLAGLSFPKRCDGRHHGSPNAAATPLGRRKPTHIWRRDQSKTASGWGSFIIDSARFLAKRRCSETLETKVTLARSCQVAREESTSPLLGLGVGRGHGPLAASWVAAAPDVRHTPHKLLDCILAQMHLSISLPKRMQISEVTGCRFQKSSPSHNRKTRGKGHCCLLFWTCGPEKLNSLSLDPLTRPPTKVAAGVARRWPWINKTCHGACSVTTTPVARFENLSMLSQTVIAYQPDCRTLTLQAERRKQMLASQVCEMEEAIAPFDMEHATPISRRNKLKHWLPHSFWYRQSFLDWLNHGFVKYWLMAPLKDRLINWLVMEKKIRFSVGSFSSVIWCEALSASAYMPWVGFSLGGMLFYWKSY